MFLGYFSHQKKVFIRNKINVVEVVEMALCGEYQTLLESELSYVCNWASLNSNFVVVTGDLNLNRLRPDKPEGKLLLDLEVEQGFECLITKPTRIEKRGIIITESLIDVLLTNRPDSFQLSGNYHPCHDLVYGVLKQKIKKVQRSSHLGAIRTLTLNNINSFCPLSHGTLDNCLMTLTIKFTCGVHL